MGPNVKILFGPGRSGFLNSLLWKAIYHRNQALIGGVDAALLQRMDQSGLHPRVTLSPAGSTVAEASFLS